jgi:DNA helicase-2/ATP-dependent DNA helicase PcrA
MSEFGGKLNDKQKEAVLSRSKIILVLAGAGTGKTSVLTSRIAFLIKKGVEPSSVFATTFTNKAANEMKDRVSSLVGKEVNINDMWIGTFHGLCNNIIKINHRLINLPKYYQIIDQDAQKSLIRRVIEEFEIRDNISIDKKNVSQDALNFINKAKEKGFRPEASSKLITLMNLNKLILDIYYAYEEIRIKSSALDYGDLILYAIEILKNNPSVLNYYQNKFKHILVDEFQDTNDIQNELIKLFTGSDNYLFVVGDDDQSIYGWRGAKIENILNFQKNNQDVHLVKLEQNYRSTKNILECANSVIGNNKARLGKDLWSDKGDGDKISIIENDYPDHEAYNITKIIRTHIEKGVPPSQITILYRNNAISRSFEAKLTESRIPYKIYGGLSFWERSEIKDMLSYLDLIKNSNNDISFERIVNKPSRKLGKKSIEKIRTHAKDNNLSMFNAMNSMLIDGTIKGASASNLKLFISGINDLKESSLNNSIFFLIKDIIDRFNFLKIYEKDNPEVQDDRINNIEELASFAKNFKNNDEDLDLLESFLHHAKLQSDNVKDSSVDSVNMMTIHTSKGLEFPIVFVVGMEDGIFPSKRSISSTKGIEEERRLAYVAFTRAEKKLYISFSSTRYNNPVEFSRFLKELPFNIIDHLKYSNYGNSPIGRLITSSENKKEVNYKSKYSIGDNYTHERYGDGEILETDKKNNSIYLKVNFEFIGLKDIYL